MEAQTKLYAWRAGKVTQAYGNAAFVLLLLFVVLLLLMFFFNSDLFFQIKIMNLLIANFASKPRLLLVEQFLRN